MTRLGVLSVLLLAAACSAGRMPAEVLPDAGGAGAGGQGADAGAQQLPGADAGNASDAGLADAGQSDAGAADAGQTDADAADAGQTDAGVTDAGQADAGVADAGQADAGAADAGTLAIFPQTCVPYDAGPAICSPQPTQQQVRASCPPPIYPAPPHVAVIGDPGPCEVVTYQGDGGIAATDQYTWSDGGLLLALAHNSADATSLTQYDSCGNLILQEGFAANSSWWAAYDYGPEGYLRSVTHSDSAGDCTSWLSYAYTSDSLGRIDGQYDGQSCDREAQLFYEGDSGRLSYVTYPPGSMYFTYYPSGLLQSAGTSGSESHTQTWDEEGALTNEQWSDIAGSSRETTFTYGAGHRLDKRHFDSDSICYTSTLDTAFSYDDGGRLLREVQTANYYSCVDQSSSATQSSTEYSYPQPGERVGDTRDADGGLTQRALTQQDGYGNLIEEDRADPPDFAWYVVTKRDFSCWH